MFLIVGLGNPEPEYCFTRHNLGFDVLNKISEKYSVKINKSGFKSIYGTGTIENEKVILCKPQTYMNLSGEAIIKFIRFYKINLSKVIIIYDDIDLNVGDVKIRKKGGAGTHNGMKSVIENLGTTEFPHVRIGTGKPIEKQNLIEYVISKLPKEEYESLKDAIDTGAEAVSQIIKNGIDNSMNNINSK